MKALLQLLLCVFSLATTALANTTNLTFENVELANHYGGLTWSGFRVINTTTAIDGFHNAAVSPVDVAIDIDGRAGEFTSSTPFELLSGYFTSAYLDGLNLEVQGFVGTSLVFDKNFTVNTTAPTLLTFDYAGIDEVKIIPSGGTLHPGYTSPGVDVTDFTIDNLTVSTPDSPATSLLLGTGLCGLALLRKKFAR